MTDPAQPTSGNLPTVLHSLCDHFGDAWEAGQRPRIEDYLAQVAMPHRPALLSELLHLELYHRTRQGEQPQRGEYEGRFPANLAILTAVFAGAQTAPPALAGADTFNARYEILGQVGHGAMGAVFRGRHRTLGLQVAIKVMLPGTSLQRFQREARLLALVTSPHVVRVHDFALVPGGRSALVMEWVEGTTIAQLIQERRAPLPEGQVLLWMRHTCEGMIAVAEQGIIHRDIKPSNLLIDGRGLVRVADFGLARSPAAPYELTHLGGIMGSPHYMAPEQAEDPHGVDTRADIYSFGATFYHALTGQVPFEGATAFAVLYKHKTEPLVSPRVHNPALSEHTTAILERCLAKSPADRFSSFAEVLRHLHPAGDTAPPWPDADDPMLDAYLGRYRARRDAYLATRGPGEEQLDVYEFPRGQVLRVVRGDITRQQVEAVVSSDTYLLYMLSGVSAAIHRAGGEAVRRQARALSPARAGRAVVTTGGRLPARLVFHGITVGEVGGQFVRPSRDLISEIMASCFYHADTHQTASLAFPLLGTGAQRFPRDLCLDTMFHFLARMLLRGLTCVREARIVLFDESWPSPHATGAEPLGAAPNHGDSSSTWRQE
jgi:O-acetyl-ADP-ribose deacetylase (regulator of RNase III)